ncbi:CDP-glycerol:glycerophosphate glycerophosphotransferase [Virgibacillus salinus]|uniref:CDP-glycerol glycerophosphotransferase, TagB/SpsB family n=1 Tax=Virgibacillus salinus TaxID=553311 RepID=A0A1H0YHP3_9BACI|nr:CDP-glycerol glycerophosphotransferase family protein [Virgibacillus salinus]SDQ14416.1 CDP-glycerol glycerophosphotransferase, TagB/SpsB family [Virgibacillus salinus]
MDQNKTRNYIQNYGKQTDIQYNQKNFLFSIIIPIYNVENYIEETILSIVKQTLEFTKHVQVILVNDGSPDNSEKICIKYRDRFPDNIIYIKKENGGVSSARNLGISHAEGKYINFLDSDDILGKDALEKVYDFFEKNKNSVDVVCLPIYYFEAKEGPHKLNEKFKKTKIINTRETPEKIQLHVSSVFITSHQAKAHKFDESLKYAEDAKYINEIILIKGFFGVLANTSYYYRYRGSQSSAIQTRRISEDWYNENLVRFSNSMINMALDKWGFVPKYLQHVIMYDLHYKFKVKDISAILSDCKEQEFIELVHGILQFIDNDVIKSQSINLHLKIFILKLKYLNETQNKFNIVKFKKNIKLYFDGKLLNSLKEQKVHINLLEVKKDRVFIEGMFVSAFDPARCELTLLFRGREIKTTRVERPLSEAKVWGIKYKEVYGFKVEFNAAEIEKPAKLEFNMKVNDVNCKLDYKISPTIKFSREFPSYYAKDKVIVSPGKKKLILMGNTFKNHFIKEAGMLKKLVRRLSKSEAGKVIATRLFYYLIKSFKRRDIYLFMDRIDKADDNAEVLFKFAVKTKDNIKKYFVISSNSSDYSRMRQYGKVIRYGSFYHKLLLMLSDKLISSHADEVIVHPFQSAEMYYKDLINFDFVFLQHGIIQNDLSGWLNKYKKNIKLFITSSQQEYDSIVNGRYGYTDEEVVCTGLARYDRLSDNADKQILIMPTWRKNISSELDQNFNRVYNKNFVQTEYFLMYNKLINDKQVLGVLEKYGYKIKFVIHPALKEQVSDFKESKNVEIINPDDVNYFELFNSSSLLITDYSSVAFDFAYLRKPVIYFQFDQFEFHRKHFSSGYFSYEDMGFGPVVSKYDDIINTITNSIKDNCSLSVKYKDRIDSFFEYNDQFNSRRVYTRIKEMD